MSILRHPTVARVALGLLTFPVASAAFAQTTKTASTTVNGGKPLFETIESVIGWACKVTSVLFTAAIILTIVFVLLAALNYITANGDPAKVKKGHQTLIWAAIGFAVALISATVPDIVAMVLGTSISALPGNC